MFGLGGLGTLQAWVSLLLTLAAFAIQLFAVIDAVRHRPDAYVAAGKRTKGFWLAVTGVAALLGFLGVGRGLNFLTIIGVVAAGVYLADVRPALRQVTGRGGTAGPYGPW
jgi:hypothetical protein